MPSRLRNEAGQGERLSNEGKATIVNEPPTNMRDPRRHKWRLWDEMQRLREEARAARADRIISTIGGDRTCGLRGGGFCSRPQFCHPTLVVNEQEGGNRRPPWPPIAL
jgi:hypothetical protein